VTRAAPPGRIVARGRADYRATLAAMRDFAERRDHDTPDEIWWMEHPPVYTLGIAGRRHSLNNRGALPVIGTERGGEITYHGPGQLVVYPLLDLPRLGWRMRQLIEALEDVVLGIAGGIARRDPVSPGVFVGDRKLASIGLRLRRGCTSHGIALNVCNDLSPFDDIAPCGRAGLRMTSLLREGDGRCVATIADLFTASLAARLGWDTVPAGAPQREVVFG